MLQVTECSRVLAPKKRCHKFNPTGSSQLNPKRSGCGTLQCILRVTYTRSGVHMLALVLDLNLEPQLPNRLATRVYKVRRDQKELSPTELDTGRSWFFQFQV